MGVHTGERPFQCIICDKAFSHASLIRITWWITVGKDHISAAIVTRFSYKIIILLIIKWLTLKWNMIRCEGNSSIIIHLRTNTGERPNQCNHCGEIFAGKIKLSKPLGTHTGENPYHWSQSDKRFIEKGVLTKHLRTHTGEKVYQCNQCDKAFIEKRKLTIHLRTQTEEKPYQCNQCDKAFAEKRKLTNVLRTHTGEKPYQCSQCGKRFT